MQKREIARSRQEEALLRLKEFERLAKSVTPIKFNANVFKNGATLALTAEELKADENDVQELATFLKDVELPALARELRSNEGVPCDSSTMQELFHRHGVNMRYLGNLHEFLLKQNEETKTSEDKERKMRGDNKQLANIVESEITFRAAKHVLNSILKDESGDSSLHLAQTVAHLLNCLLVPTPFHHYMNNMSLRYKDDTVQASFPEFPENLKSEVKQDDNDEED